MLRQSEFSWIAETPEIVFIVDLDNGGLSVTNDAENVVKACIKLYNGKRIVYRDSMNNWDELEHDGAKFTGFSHFTGKMPPSLR